MYQIVVSFAVKANHHEDFIRAAQATAAKSLAEEAGTLRFEVVRDLSDANVFYLDEVYEDEDAFNIHANGSPAGDFFAAVRSYAVGPNWRMKGIRVIEGSTA